MTTFKLTLLITDLNYLYEALKKKYLPLMVTKKQALPLTGFLYGKAPLFPATEVPIKKVTGYTGNNPYDFAFQIEKTHPMKDAFLAEFKTEWTALLARHGFTYEKGSYTNGTIRLSLTEEVDHRTNDALYCAVQVFVKDVCHTYIERRIDPNLVQKLTK